MYWPFVLSCLNIYTRKLVEKREKREKKEKEGRNVRIKKRLGEWVERQKFWRDEKNITQGRLAELQRATAAFNFYYRHGEKKEGDEISVSASAEKVEIRYFARKL